MKKQISAVLVASVIATNTSPVINVFADEVITEKSKILEKRTINQAKVTQFAISNNKNFESYNEKFRVSRDEIKSITNNGGKYGSNSIDKAIDGNTSTHWETGKPNDLGFKNEVVVEFNDVQSIDRIAYATRQDSNKGKGYPTKFEIYSSVTGNDEDFKLVSTGDHVATGNMMEFKFDTITTKKVKFVFKEAHNNWASASEFWFYKEDKMIDKLNTLFTDSSMSKVSESFNSIDKLNKLEEEAKEHPFYEDFKEDIENAKILINKDKIEPTTASTSKFNHYDNEKYSEVFKMPLSNINSIKNNGGRYANQVIENVIDGNLDTYWETSKTNNDTFKNEIEVEFKESVTLNRVVYGARKSDLRGFAQEFEIYGSKTSKGDTYELVATGKHNKTSGQVEAKFNPTEFKRLKFKFVKADANWPTLNEISFYKEDEIDDKMDRLFTDSSMSKVSDEFNTIDKIEALEKEASSHPLASTYKEDIENAKILINKDKIEPTTALTRKFDHYGNEKYSELFRMDLANIKSIKNNGGNWGSQVIKNAVDGNLGTYWETNTTNTDTFKNEVEVEFKESVTLNRVVYGARPSDRKGFAQEFEIYGSKTSKGDTYELVATGKHNTTTGQVEAKFNPTEFKRLKFKFVKADANWPTLNEISFYKEDEIADKMDRLFTDSSMSKVSEEFNTLDKIEALEKEASSHPLASTYKEDIENAKILINKDKIEPTTALTRKFDHYGNEKYSELFRMDLANIKSIKNNGGNWGSQVIKNAVDGNLGTYWETNTTNTDTFKNEVEVEFKEAVTLNRVVYGARPSDRKGFAQEFEIYGSKTSKGDTYELVATGKHNTASGQVEAKFNPTEFKRLKFKFVKADANWPTLNEISFYKEDEIADKMDRLFTDSSMSKVSDEFNTIDKIEALEKEASSHPLASTYKEYIENAKILINKDKIEATTASTSKFDYYDNKKYSEAFKMPLSNINSVKNNGGRYGNQVIENVIDGNLDTYWETSKTNTDTFKNEVEVEFKEEVTLNRVVYGARKSDRRGFAQEFEIYGSKTSKGDTYELVATGKHNTTTGQVEAKFNPTEFKRLKFKFVKADANWPTLNEISFYTEDKISDKISNVFTNGLMNELNPEYSSIEAISKLEEEVANHPLKEEHMETIKLAKSLLNNENTSNSSRVVTAEQRGRYQEESRKRSLNGALYASMESIGRYVTAGEEITVYVDADPNGVLPQLLFGQVGKGKGDWRRWQNLKPGKNVIKAPEGINPSALYVVNHAKPEDQAYAPRVRVEGGTAFPVYFHGETDPNEFYDELKEYSSKIEYDDEAFASGNPKGKVYNIAEFVSENCVITTSSKGALKGLDQIKGDNLTIYDTMEDWEEIYEMFQTFQGFEKDATDEKHSYFPNKFVSRVFIGVPHGYADHGYTGYNGSNNAARDGGFFSLIAMPPSYRANDNWAYTHEFGHITNNKFMVDGDVTNNLYAQEYRRIKGIAGDRSNWNEIFKRFKGEKFGFGYFERLAVLSQLNIAYGYDAYTKVSRALRDNEKLIASIQGNDLRRLAVAYSLGLNVNLLDFFKGWGYTDVTPQMEDAVKHLPKPDKKIEYLHGGAYDYKGTGFNENLKLEASSKINEEGKTNTLTFKIDQENANDLLGYEILKDGEVIGFTKDNSFTVKDINTSANETYEVVAYAKDLTTSDSLVVNSFAPTLKSVDKVTLKLNEEFDAKEYVKAFTYLGEAITDIDVKHNVDTKNKGVYTIEYSVTSNGQTTKKSIEVEVVSDYDYLSDEEWKSVETQWGTPRRNSNIKGRVNGDIKEFEKGFGIHANGKITYDLSNKEYDNFEALLGVDASLSAQTKSSITFKVVGDGKTLATTNVLKYADDMVYVNVPVKGVKELVIEIYNGGNGNELDHGVIANPKLTTNNAKAKITAEEVTYVKAGSDFDLMDGVSASDKEDGDLTSSVKVDSEKFNINRGGEYTITYSVTDSDNNVTTKERKVIVYNESPYLSDLEWESAVSGWKSVNKDSAVNTKNKIKLNVNGEIKEFDRGIGAATNAEIVYNLDGNYNYFTTYVGTDKNYDHNSTTIRFKIFADGKEVYTSDVIRKNSEAEFVNLNVAGVKELKLVADDVDNNGLGDFASWGDTKLYSIDKLYTKDLEKAIEEAEKLDLNNYSDETIIVLEKALSNAKEALKSGNQEIIDSSTEELKGAMDSLVEASLDEVVNIPDEYLVKSIQAQLNKTGDITLGDMRSLTTLTLSGVERLDGIEYAINLETLSMDYNEVKDLRPLANLNKLKKLEANEQFIAGEQLTPSNGKVVADSKVYNREGKNVAKTVKLVDKFGATVIEKEAEDEFVIDTTELKEGTYGVHVIFEDEGFNGMVFYIFNI